MAQNNRNVFSHSSGGQEFEIQMSMWLASLQRLQKESCMASSSFWGVSGVFLGCITPIPTSVFTWPFPPRDCLFFFYEDTCHGIQIPPRNPRGSHVKTPLLNSSCKDSFFPQKGHIYSLQGYNVKIFWEATIQPQSARLVLFLNLICPHNWFIKALKILLLRAHDN